MPHGTHMELDLLSITGKNCLNLRRKMVGARGFEPPTPGPPDQCANQAALRPV